MNHMKQLFFVLSFTLFAVFSAHGQEQVAYQTAQYPGGKEELTRMLSKELILTKKLFKAMVDENVREVTATVGLIINTKGKAVGVDVLKASHPLLDEKCFPKIEKNLKDVEFIPGSINGEPTATAIVIEGLMLVIEPVVN